MQAVDLRTAAPGGDGDGLGREQGGSPQSSGVPRGKGGSRAERGPTDTNGKRGEVGRGRWGVGGVGVGDEGRQEKGGILGESLRGNSGGGGEVEPTAGKAGRRGKRLGVA